jgi:hypothetical protein
MNDTALLICIGFIIGALASSAVWLVLVVVGKAQRQLAREKSLVMKAIAEESAEADKVTSSAVSKAMNAHALRSALSPRIDKMQKILTENMHQLDIYFVKYMESRIAAYRAAFAGGDAGQGALAVDKYLSDAKPKQTDTSAAIVQEIKARIESLGPAAQSEAMPAAPTESSEETIVAAPSFTERKTVSVPPPAAAFPAPPIAEPPALDLRTGIITVADDVREERPKRKQPAEEVWHAAPASKPQAKEKKPSAAPRTAQPEEMRPPGLDAEEAFDLEKAMDTAPKKIAAEEIVAPVDTQALHAERIEKTLQWDRNQLMGAATTPPEAIVVEGAEIAQKHQQAAKSAQPATQDPDGEEPIISGEDIENTMDSFFGLGGK